MTRRQWVAAGATTLALPSLQSCSLAGGKTSYAEAVQATWRPPSSALGDARSGPNALTGMTLLRELVRCATLAPSSHNTQCWRFEGHEEGLSILPDLSRRCPAVDPDDHHLYVSLGCAAENLSQAALVHGLHADVSLDTVRNTSRDTPPNVAPDTLQGDVLRVRLAPTRAVTSDLYTAIFARQCTRAEFDGQPVSVDELKLLERAGSGPGIRLLLLPDRAAKEKILDYVVEANTAQMADAAFVAELKHWIRFDDEEAVRKGDGLFSGASGNLVVPRWLASPLFGSFFTAAAENDKYARQLRSSAAVAVFASAKSDKAHWIEAGRCYERFSLQATALGIRSAFINQPIEVAGVRPRFARSFDMDGWRPDLVVRFGRGPEMPRSLRRPVDDVLAPASFQR